MLQNYTKILNIVPLKCKKHIKCDEFGHFFCQVCSEWIFWQPLILSWSAWGRRGGAPIAPGPHDHIAHAEIVATSLPQFDNNYNLLEMIFQKG